MNRFLDTIILDNTVRNYLLVAGVVIVVIVFKRYLSRYIAGLLFRLVSRVTKGVDKQSFINLVISPLKIFLLILVTLVALDELAFPRRLRVVIYKTTTQHIAETVAIIILIVSFIWLLLRIIDFIAIILGHKANNSNNLADNQLVVFFKDFFKVVIVINGVLLVLKFGFGLHIGSLITALSIGGAAIALATRESLENLIASFIIFFDKPFMVGDLVKVQQITGTVEKIGLRSTRIRTEQKTYVTVPNKQMVDSITDNLSLRTQRRAFVQLEVNAETPHDRVIQLINRIEHIFQERKDTVENYSVFLADINKNAYWITVEFFTAPIPIPDFNAIRQQINIDIIRLMENMQIRLASREAEVTVARE